MRTGFIITSLFIGSCGNKQITVKPTMHSITESIYASGILKSQNQYNVFSTVNGIIKEVFVVENDTVIIGSPLFNIVNESQILAEKNALLNVDFNTLSSNQGKLKEAQANIDLAKLKMKSDELMESRQQKLWSQGIGSKVELEQKEIASANSKTTYQTTLQKYNDLEKTLHFSAQQAQNNLRISQKNTSEYIVKSNIKGKVYQINLHKGEMASTQIPLAIIGNNKTYILEMQVDEYDIVSVKTGMKVFAVLNSYKDSVFSAIITKINPIMNTQSKTFTVEAKFDKPPSVLYPSITFEANILINTKKNALLIPRNYLYNDSIVFLKSGLQKTVRTGLKDFQMIEIISGVNKDDEIILPKP